MENRGRTTIILGAILIIAGILFLVGQGLGQLGWGNLWPVTVIGVGLAFLVGMALGGKQSGGLAVPGSIISMVGLILLAQNLLDWWETWSYAWALIVASVGVGIAINGSWSGDPEMRRRGLRLAGTGLVLFVVFGALSEFFFSLTNVSARWGTLPWAILLTLAGLGLTVVRFYRWASNPEQARERGEDLFWPLLLLGFGVLGLLIGMGRVPTERLWTVLNLWPLLIIVLGLHLIFGRRAVWLGAVLGAALAAAIVFVAVAGGQLGLPERPTWFLPSGMISISEPIRERVVGSGDVAQETREVRGIRQVRLELPGELEISVGATEALVIEAEGNLLPYIASEVRGRELVIRAKPGVGITPNRTIHYRLSVVELEAVQTASSGTIAIGPLTAEDLELRISASGGITADELRADKLTVRISSSGSIAAKGQARELDLNISSSGNYVGPDLRCERAEVGLTSSGQATLWVTERLDATLSSSGNVSYYGSPTVRPHTSSSGRVIKLGEK